MASEAPRPRAGSELKKQKRAGSRELKLMAFAFLSDENGGDGRGGKERDTKSNFPLPACGFSNRTSRDDGFHWISQEGYNLNHLPKAICKLQQHKCSRVHLPVKLST
jgi:hypothetical protein